MELRLLRGRVTGYYYVARFGPGERAAGPFLDPLCRGMFGPVYLREGEAVVSALFRGRAEGLPIAPGLTEFTRWADLQEPPAPPPPAARKRAAPAGAGAGPKKTRGLH